MGKFTNLMEEVDKAQQDLDSFRQLVEDIFNELRKIPDQLKAFLDPSVLSAIIEDCYKMAQDLLDEFQKVIDEGRAYAQLERVSGQLSGPVAHSFANIHAVAKGALEALSENTWRGRGASVYSQFTNDVHVPAAEELKNDCIAIGSILTELLIACKTYLTACDTALAKYIADVAGSAVGGIDVSKSAGLAALGALIEGLSAAIKGAGTYAEAINNANLEFLSDLQTRAQAILTSDIQNGTMFVDGNTWPTRPLESS